MLPIENIRRNILNLTQGEMAQVAGVVQTTVSRWETGRSRIPGEAMGRIRAEARRRQIAWDDDLFFEIPVVPEVAA